MRTHYNIFLFVVLLTFFINLTPLSHRLVAANNSDEFSSGTVAIWQGFRQSWTYNHRLQRLGDMVSAQKDSASQVTVHTFHAAATGLGSDIGTYTSYYSLARIRNAHYYQGMEDFQFVGKKGELHQITRTIRIPFKGQNSANLHMVAILNGFDIYTKQNALKLQDFRLQLSEVTFDSSKSQATFTLTAGVRFDCRSLECKKFDPTYNYTLRVGYLLLKSGQQDIAVQSKQIVNTFQWNKRQELKIPMEKHSITGEKNSTYSHAVLALTSLDLHLDKEHWFIDWSSCINPEHYDALAGKYDFNSGLIFREWREGMRRDSAKPMESMFSFRDKGSGSFAAEVTLIQFNNGCSAADSISGKIPWEGRGKEKHIENAVDQHRVFWNPDCFKNE